jgi:hypothetical protein
MPRTVKQAQNEATISFVGMYSMSSSSGKSTWHIARMLEGVESKRILGHTDMTDDDGNSITYPSKASARIFIEGYTCRDNEILEDENVG